MEEGDIVFLTTSEFAVKQEFAKVNYIWNDQMKGMLGKRFPILEILEDGDIIALPSPDGSQNGKWYFPKRVLKIVPGKTQSKIQQLNSSR